jgi:hypothetical protein
MYNSCMEKQEKTLTIRLSADLLEGMRAIAREHNRSLNGEILTVLHDYVTRHKPKGARAKAADA